MLCTNIPDPGHVTSVSHLSEAFTSKRSDHEEFSRSLVPEPR